jgi:hypothetical protein
MLLDQSLIDAIECFQRMGTEKITAIGTLPGRIDRCRCS